MKNHGLVSILNCFSEIYEEMIDLYHLCTNSCMNSYVFTGRAAASITLIRVKKASKSALDSNIFTEAV